MSRLEKSRRGWGGVGGVGEKSAFIHGAWDTPRPYPSHPDHLPHPPHPPHPLPKYSSSDKELALLLGEARGGLTSVGANGRSPLLTSLNGCYFYYSYFYHICLGSFKNFPIND
ncbi:MAG: hypothetical protein F6K40_37965 [Okeania sp. SIO3I5]|uniref:hypothetical protein n=1 Tax=Okeania sp. SIO3I5 TaxID=2607805 RepID=UPI0013BAD09A|nr:hypothetical protein [Okeania sp. SIO3I5]NEQ41668.1 hypothetical protein [Okeania sp. SIO3I5]